MFKAMVRKDLLQNLWTMILAFCFGLFFASIFVASYDTGTFQEEYDFYADQGPINRDGPSLFIESEELVIYMCAMTSVAFPILYSLIIHREIETKTIKAVATYPLSFNRFKLLKLGSLTVNGGMALLILGLMPVAMAILVGGTARMLLEALTLWLLLVITMGLMALAAFNVNDLLVSVFGVRRYMSNILFALLVFISIFFSELVLTMLYEVINEESYTFANEAEKPWGLINLPMLSPFHVVSRACDSLFNGWRGFDGYPLLILAGGLAWLTHYLRPHQEYDDWF